jgi:CRP-like cAMP-binding protein
VSGVESASAPPGAPPRPPAAPPPAKAPAAAKPAPAKAAATPKGASAKAPASGKEPATAKKAARPRETLAQIPIMRTLDTKTVARLDTQCAWRHRGAKEWIIEHQEPSTDVYFLTAGAVRALIHASADRDVILADLKAGQFFGEMAAIDGKPRSSSIMAMTQSTIASMPASVFKQLLREHAEFNEQVMLMLVTRIRTLNQRIHEFSTLHVKQRICAELLRNSRPDPTTPRQAIITPPPPHAEIAARVSTGREMVVREFKALERAGLLIRRRGALVLTDVSRLMQELKQKE